jgi:uncharacterized protein YndB with AHSA1/START domain
MKVIDLRFSRLIAGPATEVFDVWFDPQSPGGPWHGAKKVIMNLAVDGIFFFGVDTPVAQAHLGGIPLLERPDGLLGHFGRFTAIDRPRAAAHTWMSEHTHGIETTVSVAFEARQGGTQLTIIHRGIPDDEIGRKHERGWEWLLSRLEQHFTRS